MTETSAPARTAAPFTGEMTVQDAMKHHPVARWVFFSFNLVGCNACSISESETLAQLSSKYGVSLELLLADLNDLIS